MTPRCCVVTCGQSLVPVLWVSGARLRVGGVETRKMANNIETKVLDGKAIAAEIRKQAKEELEDLQKKFGKFEAKLVIVQVRSHLQ